MTQLIQNFKGAKKTFPKYFSWFLLILLMAVGARVAAGLYLGFDAPPDREACGADAVEFESLAWSVTQGKGYVLDGQPTAFRAPGYPLLLSAAYGIFGRAYWANKILQILFGVLTCWLTYLLARRLRLSRPAALWAMTIMALLPTQVYYTGHFVSEIPYTFFNLLSVILVIDAFRHDDHKAYLFAALAGLVCGYGTLIRAQSLIFPVLIGAVRLIFKPNIKDFVKSVVLLMIMGVCMLAVILPWSMRNKNALGHFSLVATNGGSTFWGANNPLTSKPGVHWGGWVATNLVDPELKKREVAALSNEVDRDKKEWEIGRRYLKENPQDIPMLMLGKILRILNPVPDSQNKMFVLVISSAAIPFFLLTAAGIVLAVRRHLHNERFFYLWANLLVLAATVVIFYGYERFRAPFEPLLAVYAAIACQGFIQNIRRSSKF